MARPQLEIDGEEVLKLAQLGCKVTEIAEWFGCSTDTIHRRFAAELSKGWANLKTSLRKWQLESAKKGNVTMQIWLGKQMLGQRDKSEEEVAQELQAKGLPATIEQLVQLTKQSITGEVNGSNGSKANSGKDSEEIAKPH